MLKANKSMSEDICKYIDMFISSTQYDRKYILRECFQCVHFFQMKNWFFLSWIRCIGWSEWWIHFIEIEGSFREQNYLREYIHFDSIKKNSGICEIDLIFGIHLLNSQTYAADVLISINPYESLPAVYGSEQIDRYLDSNTLFEQPSHVYAIGTFNFISICIVIDS